VTAKEGRMGANRGAREKVGEGGESVENVCMYVCERERERVEKGSPAANEERGTSLLSYRGPRMHTQRCWNVRWWSSS